MKNIILAVICLIPIFIYSNAFPFTDSKTGFVYSINGLILRDNPNQNSNKITTIPNKAQLQIIEQKDNVETINGISGRWTKIIYEKYIGWVFGGFLSKQNSTPSATDMFSNKSKADIIEELTKFYINNNKKRSSTLLDLHFANETSHWNIRQQTFTESDYIFEEAYEGSFWKLDLKTQKYEFEKYQLGTTGENNHNSSPLAVKMSYIITGNANTKMEKIDPWHFEPAGCYCFEYVSFLKNSKIIFRIDIYEHNSDLILKGANKILFLKRGSDIISIFENEILEIMNTLSKLNT